MLASTEAATETASAEDIGSESGATMTPENSEWAKFESGRIVLEDAVEKKVEASLSAAEEVITLQLFVPLFNAALQKLLSKSSMESRILTA